MKRTIYKHPDTRCPSLLMRINAVAGIISGAVIDRGAGPAPWWVLSTVLATGPWGIVKWTVLPPLSGLFEKGVSMKY